ncbi:hypothetical protein ACFDR9_003299 [Janthinobacterium sp. CG_23.3]
MQNTQSQAEAAQAHGPKTMLKGWKILNLGGLAVGRTRMRSLK